MISAATEKTSPACWSVSGNLFQRMGIALRNDLRLSAFCLRSHRIQMCFVCTGKRSGEEVENCMEKPVRADTLWRFHARIGI